MSVKEKTLEILEKNKNTPLSGEALAQSLGVSRAAVWKAVKSLRAEGYEITSATNRGYILSPHSDILSAPAVKNFLRDEALDANLTILKTVDSTNTYAKKLAIEGAPEKTVVAAETQTAGRGRLGRSFYSPEKTGLYLSVILRPQAPAEEASFITITAALAVCMAIEALTGASPQIKWVNDIFLNGKKVCGILTEGETSMETRLMEYAVLGIGINVKPATFPEDLRKIAGSLGNSRLSRNKLCAEILNQLFKLNSKNDRNFIISEYKKRSLVPGKTVNFVKNGIPMTGTAADINDQGNLIVNTSHGTEILISGEISIGSENYAN